MSGVVTDSEMFFTGKFRYEYVPVDDQRVALRTTQYIIHKVTLYSLAEWNNEFQEDIMFDMELERGGQ